MEPYPSGQFGFIDDLVCRFGRGSVWTRTGTRSDSPELLLTLTLTTPIYHHQHRQLSVIKPKKVRSNILFLSATASWSGQFSCDPYDLSSNNEWYLSPGNVAAMTPRQSDCAARLLTATQFNLNSPSEAPMLWGRVNPHLNHYHSDPMEIWNAFSLPHISDGWRHQDETQ